MKQLLFINACARPDSRTYRLAKEVLKKCGGEAKELKLYEESLAPLDLQTLEKRNRLCASGCFDDPMFRYAKEFAQADGIVIAAPYWDLAFPSILKIYLEHITVSGITFQYSPEGIPEGLCRAERLLYVMTAGGPVYENLGFQYVKSLSRTFYGISEACCVKAEGLDLIGADAEAILQKTMEEIGALCGNLL